MTTHTDPLKMALSEAREFLSSLIEFTKPLSNFDGYTRLAMSAHEICNRVPEAIAKIDAALAPKQQAQAGEADSERIELICHAYESGFGHGEKQDGLTGPYFESDECNQAYTIGYDAGKEVAEERAALQPQPQAGSLINEGSKAQAGEAERAESIIKDIEELTRLADNMGRSRGQNNYCNNRVALDKFVDLKMALDTRIRAALQPQPQAVDEQEEFQQHWACCGFVPDGANPDHIYAAMQSGWMGRASLAQPTVAAEQEDALLDAVRDKIITALGNHRLVNIYEMEDGGPGNNFPLIDRLSLEGAPDIQSGREEIEAIADMITDTVEKELMSIASKRIHARNCLCSKCLQEFERAAHPASVQRDDSQQDLIESNRQAWAICDAVAAALGDDLDKEAGSAASVARIRDEMQQLRSISQQAKEQEPVGEVVGPDDDKWPHLGWHFAPYVPWEQIGAGRKLFAAPPQAEAKPDDSWRTLFIVARPGMAPRIGLPIGEVAASLREWYAHNPEAEIYVVNSWGSSAGCQTVENGREILFFDDAMSQAEAQSKPKTPTGISVYPSRSGLATSYPDGQERPLTGQGKEGGGK